VFELLDEAEELPDPVAPTILAEPAAITFEGVLSPTSRTSR
jgi:hypothetical protein